MANTCPICGGAVFRRPGPGQPPRYCTFECGIKAQRERDQRRRLVGRLVEQLAAEGDEVAVQLLARAGV
ncbi:hypothetical protein [Streptomyces phaeochromogenes]